jgi:integrase/recombinase XerD
MRGLRLQIVAASFTRDPMLPHIDDFSLNLQGNEYSPGTLYDYMRHLKVFDNFLAENGIGFDKLTKFDLTRYKAYLVSPNRKTSTNRQAQKQLDASSINSMLSALRAYLHYLFDIDYPSPILAEAVKLARLGKKHPQIAELQDMVRLIESPSYLEANSYVALRNRAMLEIIFASGMRISELCNLNRNQINGNGRILIMGKGRKERFVYITPRARQHLNSYLAIREDDCPALFIPYRGRNVTESWRRVSINYLQDRIKRYRETLKINIPTSAHSLRHGFATYMAEAGASPAALQILLGHESLNTTTRYIHASDRYAEEVHHKYHPLAKPD